MYSIFNQTTHEPNYLHTLHIDDIHDPRDGTG